MSNFIKAEKRFYSRRGMQNFAAITRQELRRKLAAGLIDAQTLISVDDDRRMLPLAASEAAGEISWAARFWSQNYSPVIYCCWLIFVPLLTAGVAGYGIGYQQGALYLMPLAVIIAQVGLSFWIYRTWRVLLAGDKVWKPFVYAFPLAIPVLDLIWVWIGYMPLIKYWREFCQRHDITGKVPYKLYYLVMIAFYLQSAAVAIWIFADNIDEGLIAYIAGIATWLWLGLTLVSLFITDRITTLLIRSKLHFLAYGSLRFCAQINYDALEKASHLLEISVKRSFYIFTAILLLISYLLGGWFWMQSLDVYLNECNKSTDALIGTMD